MSPILISNCCLIFQASLTVIRGPVIDEVHQHINSWIHQVPCFLSTCYLYMFSFSSVTVIGTSLLCDNENL